MQSHHRHEGAETAEALRQRAARFRRLAQTVVDDATRAQIEALADELEEQAVQLEWDTAKRPI